MNGIYLYDYKRKNIRYLTSDDRIIRNENEKRLNVVPVVKPVKPLKPLKRYRMSTLEVDILMYFYIEILTLINEFDNKFLKYLNTKLYASNGKFLGNINLNRYDSDSTVNSYPNSPLFIKNRNNEIIGKISDNKFIDVNVISATYVFNWFKNKID